MGGLDRQKTTPVEVAYFCSASVHQKSTASRAGDLDKDLVERIRKKGKEINENLNESAGTPRRLMSKGREGSGTLYDISPFEDVPLGEARRELAEFGDDEDVPRPIER